MLTPWNPELTISEMEFHLVSKWVQVHGLLWNRVDECIVWYIGFKLGRLLEIDKK